MEDSQKTQYPILIQRHILKMLSKCGLA